VVAWQRISDVTRYHVIFVQRTRLLQHIKRASHHQPMYRGRRGWSLPARRPEKYSWTWVKTNPATENSLWFRSCRPPIMSNSHFEGSEDILTPQIGTGINGIPLKHPWRLQWFRARNLRLIRLYTSLCTNFFTFWYSWKRFCHYTECINTPVSGRIRHNLLDPPPRRNNTSRLIRNYLTCTEWPEKVVHFSTHHIFVTFRDKMKRISLIRS